MPYAIELFLDERADRQVRRIWAALDEHGIPSVGSIHDSNHHPHVTLSVFERGNPAQVAQAIRPLLATSVGMPLPLEPLGFFLTDEAPVFLGVVPSYRLIALHHAVHQATEPLVQDIGPHYRPDALLPHCTLAVAVSARDRPRALNIVNRLATTPIPALASSAHLVEVPSGHTQIPLTAAHP